MFDPTISSSLFTGWIVMLIIVVLAFLHVARHQAWCRHGRQNALEYVYEGLANFATSLGGPKARRYVPAFAALLPVHPAQQLERPRAPASAASEQLRAPTSDVNTTIGLALVASPCSTSRASAPSACAATWASSSACAASRTASAPAVIALFVGVIEFFLEFIKPVTLAMRLFGNIYGGEVALGVITGLTIALIPVAMVGLEFLLNFMQALIFAVLTLMFTIIATESHDDHEEHEVPEGNIAPPIAHGQPAAAH